MKLGIFTTDTTHHSYYTKCLKEIVDDIVVFCETEVVTFPFETKHEYEIDQIKYETNSWFDGDFKSISKFAKTLFFKNINQVSVIEHLKRENLDAVIVFGTSRIKRDIIEHLPKHIFNLHGGDPELYRGLDTHLWSIYHNDFTSLVTTLHKLDNNLDTGDIICKNRLEVKNNLPLYMLRSVNTETCIKLSEIAIESLKKNGEIISTRQKFVGRYYSAMPSSLKNICKNRFEKYSSTINK